MNNLALNWCRLQWVVSCLLADGKLACFPAEWTEHVSYTVLVTALLSPVRWISVCEQGRNCARGPVWDVVLSGTYQSLHLRQLVLERKTDWKAEEMRSHSIIQENKQCFLWQSIENTVSVNKKRRARLLLPRWCSHARWNASRKQTPSKSRQKQRSHAFLPPFYEMRVNPNLVMTTNNKENEMDRTKEIFEIWSERWWFSGSALLC